MSTFKERLEDQRLLWTLKQKLEWSDEYTFMAGARAALLLAAEDLAEHDTHRWAGRENVAYNAAMAFVDKALRARAEELKP